MTRGPVAAGLFYPAGRAELAAAVDALLAGAGRSPDPGVSALVAPHAGYAYSGPAAARAFALLPPVERVVLLGPSHFVPLRGLAVSGADRWATPLGELAVSADLRDAAVAAGAVVHDAPHASDHALEVELPFLQHASRGRLEILPVAVGEAGAGEVAGLLEALDAFVVVSSDLSHYRDDATARRLDRATADAVVRREPDSIEPDAACGYFALRGLVEHARRRGRAIELLDLRTSADATGDRERVVGYGAFAVRGDA